MDEQSVKDYRSLYTTEKETYVDSRLLDNLTSMGEIKITPETCRVEKRKGPPLNYRALLIFVLFIVLLQVYSSYFY